MYCTDTVSVCAYMQFNLCSMCMCEPQSYEACVFKPQNRGQGSMYR